MTAIYIIIVIIGSRPPSKTHRQRTLTNFTNYKINDNNDTIDDHYQTPPELSYLNALEIRLISLRIPFMKMVALPSGKQRCIHGPAVNEPSKLDSGCTVLPRLPSQSELIPLKLKRKLAYKGHYLYDYITPDKILTALKWLKTHNPLYADIEINEEWVHNAESNVCTFN